MTTVTGYTKEKMDEINNSTIVDGDVVGGNLILKTRDNTPINAGSVIGPTGPPSTVPGPTGPQGPVGPQGPTGPTGPIGAMKLAKFPYENGTTGATYSTSGFTDMVLNNIPVVNGNTYLIDYCFEIYVSSFGGDPKPRWDFHAALNGSIYRHIGTYESQYVGQYRERFTGWVLWLPTVTRATDDVSIYAANAVGGAIFEITDSARHLAVWDCGVVT